MLAHLRRTRASPRPPCQTCCIFRASRPWRCSTTRRVKPHGSSEVPDTIFSKAKTSCSAGKRLAGASRASIVVSNNPRRYKQQPAPAAACCPLQIPHQTDVIGRVYVSFMLPFLERSAARLGGPVTRHDLVVQRHFARQSNSPAAQLPVQSLTTARSSVASLCTPATYPLAPDQGAVGSV